MLLIIATTVTKLHRASFAYMYLFRNCFLSKK